MHELLPGGLQARPPESGGQVNLEFFLLLGTFVLGVLVMGWIKSFQIESIRMERDLALRERDKALEGQTRTQHAADVVVETGRVLRDARDLPPLDGFRVLLNDRGDDDPPASGPPARPAA